MDDALQKLIIEQAKASFAALAFEELERERSEADCNHSRTLRLGHNVRQRGEFVMKLDLWNCSHDQGTPFEWRQT